METFSRFIPFYIIIGLISLFFYILRNLFDQKQGKSSLFKYKYTLKQYLLTRKEHVFFNTLNAILGGKYYIFPQVHFSSFLDHKNYKQNWQGALSHIQRKSVDYLVCDKENIAPIMAIELDDRSHEREDRITRDQVVEQIFQNAGLPLVRITYDEMHNKNLVEKKIYEATDTI